MLIFYKQESYFSQIVSKKAKIAISFFTKNSKDNNIILGFNFQFYVFGFSLFNKQKMSESFMKLNRILADLKGKKAS